MFGPYVLSCISSNQSIYIYIYIYNIYKSVEKAYKNVEIHFWNKLKIKNIYY